jgi:hypothetical protein
VAFTNPSRMVTLLFYLFTDLIQPTGETGESQYGNTNTNTQTQIGQLRQENEKLIAKVDKLSKALEASLHQK